MSQYYNVVNLDKKQFFSPHIFNDGVKLGAVMNGIHPYVIGRLLLSEQDSTAEKFGTGYWSGDKIAIIGDESINEFNNQQSEFVDIGIDLLFSFLNDKYFQDLFLKQLKTDNLYYAQIGFLVRQYPDKAVDLNKFIIHHFGNDWEKNAKEIWADKETTFNPLSGE